MLLQGSVSFSASTSATVVIGATLSSSSYQVSLSMSASASAPPWVTAKSTTTFTVNFASAYTGSVDWIVDTGGDVKISALPAGATPTGTELVPSVQSGATVSLTAAQIAAQVTLAGLGGTTAADALAAAEAAITLSSLGGTTLAEVETTIDQAYIGEQLYPQTAAEILVSVTPTNYQYPCGTVDRYGTNTTPGTTDMTAAIQTAITVTLPGLSNPNYIHVVSFLNETYLVAGTISFTLPFYSSSVPANDPLVIDFGGANIIYSGTGSKWHITGRAASTSGPATGFETLHLMGSGSHVYSASGAGCTDLFLIDDLTECTFDIINFDGNSLVQNCFRMRNVNFWSERLTWPVLRMNGFTSSWMTWENGGSTSNSFARQYIGTCYLSGAPTYGFVLNGQLYDSVFDAVTGNIGTGLLGLFFFGYTVYPGLEIRNIGVEGGGSGLITGGSSYYFVFANPYTFNAGNQNFAFPKWNILDNIIPGLNSSFRLLSQQGVTPTSITSTGGVATVTLPAAHGVGTGNSVTVVGATQSGYNVVSAILTSTGANTFTYPVTGSPTSPATGTILVFVESVNNGASIGFDLNLNHQRRQLGRNDQVGFGYGTQHAGLDEGQEITNTAVFHTWSIDSLTYSNDTGSKTIVHEYQSVIALANNLLAAHDYYTSETKIAAIRVWTGASSVTTGQIRFYTRGSGSGQNISSFERLRITENGALQALTTANGPVGTFTLSAASTTTVANTSVTANSIIILFPTNSAAAGVMGSTKSLYVSAKTAGASFAVTTGNGSSAAGTETFNYLLLN